MYPEYNTKLTEDEAPILEISEIKNTPSLPLLSSPLWLGAVVSIRVPSMSKIEIFNHLLYHLTMCKQMRSVSF